MASCPEQYWAQVRHWNVETGTGKYSIACSPADSAHGCVVPRLGHVILYVTDLDTSVAFYRDVAGPHRFTDAGTRSSIRINSVRALRAAPGRVADGVLCSQAPPERSCWWSRTSTRWPPDCGFAACPCSPSRPWGHRTVHVADPDGFVVEFAQEIPRARSRGH